MSSRPPAQPSRSLTSSDNSHTSGSAGSPRGSNYSSNTSSGTHFPSIAPLPRGAEPPEVNIHVTEYDVGASINAKRKARVLRKPHPPPSISNASIRSGKLFYGVNRGPSSGSSPVSVSLNDTASFLGSSHYQSLFAASVLPPTLSYEVARPSHSLHDRYESQAVDGHMPPAEHEVHTFGTLTRSTSVVTSVVERPRMKTSRFDENEGSHALTKNDSCLRLSITMDPPLVRRDKPLPNLPGFSPSSNGVASSKPIEPLTSHRRPPDVYPSYPLPSGEGPEEPLLNHFVARSSMSNSPDEFKRYAHTEVGHTQTWSESRLSASVTRYAYSDAHYHVSKSQHRHSQDLRSSNHSRTYSTASRSASRFSQFPTTSVPPLRPTRPAALYNSKPTIPDAQGLTRGLSWGKRLVRSLSVALFRKESVTDNPVNDLPYLESDSGHSTYHQHVTVVHPTVPFTQHHVPAFSSPRKLRKRPPSFSHSRWSTSTPILTSSSSPALNPNIYRSRESVFELYDAPSQNTHSEFDTSPTSSPNKKHSRSNSRRDTTASKSMTRHPGLNTSTPALSASWKESQPTPPPTSPTSSGARKLMKRHKRRKIAQGAADEYPSLPPLRTQSPINLNLNSHSFSDASRYCSAPNIGPSDSSRLFPSSQFVASPADPLSESPHASEFSAGERPWSKHHQDFPSLLQSGSSRRWTLAVFDAPEEQLVEELDRLRNVGWGPGFQGELVRVKSGFTKNIACDQEHGPGAILEKDELEEWLVARKALMVCREIVRTEKSYREGLINLQRGETMKPPPPLLLQYLPALISASQAFSARLDEDPSTYGVSVAFFAAEEALEVALVAWSGIVGEFFGAAKGKQPKRRLTDIGLSEKEKKGKDKSKKDKNKVTDTSVPPPVAPPPVALSDLGHAHDQPTHPETRDLRGNRRTSMPTLSQFLPSSTERSLSQRKSWYFSASPAPTAAKLPTVQDLAIQPTQRVMRYVLLYKDLLNSTPVVSPARGLVERALEGASRIAHRCNRAQDNAAFLT